MDPGVPLYPGPGSSKMQVGEGSHGWDLQLLNPKTWGGRGLTAPTEMQVEKDPRGRHLATLQAPFSTRLHGGGGGIQNTCMHVGRNDTECNRMTVRHSCDYQGRKALQLPRGLCCITDLMARNALGANMPLWLNFNAAASSALGLN